MKRADRNRSPVALRRSPVASRRRLAREIGSAGDRIFSAEKRSGSAIASSEYAVYVPRDWTADAKAGPRFLFLHGKGRVWRTTGLGASCTQDSAQAILNAPQDWPFVVIFPQKPSEEYEVGGLRRAP